MKQQCSMAPLYSLNTQFMQWNRGGVTSEALGISNIVSLAGILFASSVKSSACCI